MKRKVAEAQSRDRLFGFPICVYPWSPLETACISGNFSGPHLSLRRDEPEQKGNCSRRCTLIHADKKRWGSHRELEGSYPFGPPLFSVPALRLGVFALLFSGIPEPEI